MAGAVDALFRIEPPAVTHERPGASWSERAKEVEPGVSVITVQQCSLFVLRVSTVHLYRMIQRVGTASVSKLTGHRKTNAQSYRKT